jgi:hypothetical protein
MHWNAAKTTLLANTGGNLHAVWPAFQRRRPIWAPRYRQATLGAFLTERPGAKGARCRLWRCALRLRQLYRAGRSRLPIVLVGHSQGAFHLMRLMRDRVAGKPMAARIAAAYVVGWPVSLDA